MNCFFIGYNLNHKNRLEKYNTTQNNREKNIPKPILYIPPQKEFNPLNGYDKKKKQVHPWTGKGWRCVM